MDVDRVARALEQLADAKGPEDLRQAFATFPELRSPALEELVRLNVETTHDPAARRIAEMQQHLLTTARRGDYEGAWSTYEHDVLQLVNDFVKPHADSLSTRVRDAATRLDWDSFTSAADELLIHVYNSPPEIEYNALQTVADAASSLDVGHRADGVEIAIRCHRRMLELLHEHGDPDDGRLRATAIANMGSLYGQRLAGDPLVNQDIAIEHLRHALRLVDGSSDRESWATAQTNLGLALLNRASELRVGPIDIADTGIESEDVDDRLLEASAQVEEALEHFEEALTWRSFERNSYDWAFTQTNTGLAFARRRAGDRRANLEKAVHHYREGLRGFRHADQRHHEAIAQLDVSGALFDLAGLEETVAGERVSLLADALGAVDAALSVWRLDSVPVEAGRALSLKGDILWSLGRVEEAAEAYRAALTGVTPETAGRLSRKVARQLAQLEIGRGDWLAAADAWEIAVAAAAATSDLRASSAERLDELSENQNVHRWAAFAAVQAERPRRAVELLEAGRSQELMRHLVPEDPDLRTLSREDPALAQRFGELEKARSQLERDLRAGRAVARTNAAEISEAARSALLEIRSLPGLERFRMSPRFAEIATPLEAGEALVYLLTAPQGSAGLIVTGENGGTVHVVAVDDLTSLGAYEVFMSYDLEAESLGGLFYGHVADPQQDPQALETALTRAEELLSKPLLEPIWRELKTREVRRVCLIPIALLGLLPLHALSWQAADSRRRCLLDDFDVTFAPSAAMRSICKERMRHRRTEGTRFLVVANPAPTSQVPLDGTEFEARAIIAAFPTDELVHLSGESATKERAAQEAPLATHIHFACHGAGTLFGRPYETFLLLANDEPWSATDILDGPPLKADLIVASACESALIQGGASAYDEALSLGSVFLAAGAAASISTLWSIDDWSTALLMTRFYENLGADTTRSPASALREAQLWLRDMNMDEIDSYVATRAALVERRTMTRAARDPSTAPDGAVLDNPFKSPAFWGAFVLAGA